MHAQFQGMEYALVSETDTFRFSYIYSTQPKIHIHHTQKYMVVARKLLKLGIYTLNHLGIFPSLYSYDLTNTPQLLGTTSICSLTLSLSNPTYMMTI